jgi:[protein-PII] uridylyltransferase
MVSSATLEALIKIANERRELLRTLDSLSHGLAWCEKNTSLVDAGITIVINELVGSTLELAVVATGGYARKELAPYSDADLTVVTSSQADSTTDQQIRTIFNALNEIIEPILEIKVSYAYRMISDLEGIDPITRSALLDIRLLAGSDLVYQSLKKEIISTHPIGEFITEKLTERTLQLSKTNSSALVSEPNLKEGAGGVRDFHSLNWIRDSLSESRLLPSGEYDTVIAVRNLLQKVVGRKIDLLNRTRQVEIADLTGVRLDDLMNQVTRSAELLNKQYVAAVDSIPESAFKISQGVYARKGEVWVEPKTEAGIASVGIALASKLNIRVTNFPTGCSKTVNGPAILYSLSNGIRTIRNLDKCGLLAEIFPELEACRYLQAEDAIHQYTVFEHSLLVAENIFTVGRRGWLEEVYDQIPDDGLLVLAALLHDVGKKFPNEDHSLRGAEIARQVGARINLSSDQCELLSWLIENHLVMDHFMRFRDLDQHQTIEEFKTLIPSVDALNHLTLLTISDSSAVALNLWNTSQETFLRRLYERTVEALTAQEATTPDVSLSRKNVLRLLKGSSDESDSSQVAKMQELLEQLPAYYLASTPSEIVRIHVDYVSKARRGVVTIETFDRHDISATEFTICAPDQKALLSKILAVFYAYELSISDIKACTTFGDNAVALDVITVRFGSQVVPPATRKQVANKLYAVLLGELDALELMRQRGKDPDRKLEVIEWNFYPGSPSRLEIRSPRGRGLPFRLSRWIAEENWNIQSARLGQWAGKAAATFYLSSIFSALSQKDVELAVNRLSVD